MYENGIEVIGRILSEVEQWMDSKGYSVVDEFRGKLSKVNLADPFAYQRAQYIDILLNQDSIFNKTTFV